LKGEATTVEAKSAKEKKAAAPKTTTKGQVRAAIDIIVEDDD